MPKVTINQEVERVHFRTLKYGDMFFIQSEDPDSLYMKVEAVRGFMVVHLGTGWSGEIDPALKVIPVRLGKTVSLTQA